MTARADYNPGPPRGARIEKKDGEMWGLILIRELRHAPEKVWEAITDPAQISQWAPFDASGSLATQGATVKLTTVASPKPYVSETTVSRAERPKLLVYQWGASDMRWELDPYNGGTRLTLWTSINRRFIAMGAAGWHICFDVLDHLLSDDPLGRTVGPEAMQIDGWQDLHAGYAKQFEAT
jgi:uncharacterized protein YndB with AHSA1/START domain